MIEVDNLQYAAGGLEVLREVSFRVERGGFCAIIGANGAGKSTLTKLIRGLLRPSAGKVLIDGQEVAGLRPSALAARIGYLFQNPDRQLCKNTVGEELGFTLSCVQPDKTRRSELLSQTLEAFGFTGGEELSTMSRGERQRVALCSALVSQPEILLLDEPTTGLDYRECTQIMEHIAAQNARGVTVVMVCHDMELVLDYAKRCVVLADGRKAGEGAPREVFADSRLLESASLLPPQLVGLAARFNELGAPCTVDEFTDAILERRRAS